MIKVVHKGYTLFESLQATVSLNMDKLVTSLLILAAICCVGFCLHGEDTYGEPSTEDGSGVLGMNGDVHGYDQVGSKKTITGGAIKLELFLFHSWDTSCLRVVIIYLHGIEMQRVKVPCGPSNSKSLNSNYQFGKAFTIRPQPGNEVFTILYNIPNQYCIRRTYTITSRNPLRFQQSVDERTHDQECAGLKQGRDVLRTQAPTGNWVLEMNGNMNGYTPNEGAYCDLSGRCVNLVVIRIYGALAQRLKMTCGGDGKGREQRGQYQLGSAFMFRPEPETNKIKGLFNIRNEYCFRIVYTVRRGNPTEITRSNGVKTNDQECRDLMSGKDLISGPVCSRPGAFPFGIQIPQPAPGIQPRLQIVRTKPVSSSVPVATPIAQPASALDWFGGLRSAFFGGKK